MKPALSDPHALRDSGCRNIDRAAPVYQDPADSALQASSKLRVKVNGGAGDFSTMEASNPKFT